MRGISPTTPLRPLLARAALAAALLLAAPAAARAALADGGEYYVVSDYYSKVLGLNADGTTPRLSVPGTNADAATYVVVAEASGEAGWWRLRNKGTGKYLRASTSDTWSVGWSDAGGTGSEFLWRLDVQFGRSIVCKRNQDKRLGCDWTEEAYVPVYYDKPASSRTRFSVVPALPGGFGASMAAARTEVFANDIGTQEQDVYSVAEALTLDRPIDLHLISGDAPIAEGGSVDIADRDAWVVFENVRPSEVIEKYLQRITVGGVAARNGTNVRVAIYLDGAAVIPWLRRDAVLTGFDGAQCTGEKKELVVQNATTLGAWNNRIRSFILKRGFMATLASGTGGGGYTRVYVADHADLVVPSLPEALDLRISSVHIKPWQYASKKGWCSTQGNSGIAAGAAKMKASWFYTWSADRQTTADCEYAPIRQHVYWPSLSTIGGLSGSTHVLGFNEPDHSEQHDKCDCGGTISSWTATTKTPEMAAVGMRVGSPAPTDASWLTEYIGHVDDMAYRCDFVAFHAYWGPNEANGASAWYERLKAIYDKTKRPIWITEWAYGASWTTETWPSKYGDQLEKNRAAVMEIVDMLERAPFVERYAYYQWDTSSRRFINDDGWVTPAGRVYRDTKSTFAYNASMQKAPNWWRPSTKTPTLAYTVDTDKQEVVFALGNTNGDLAATLVVERRAADGTWTAFHEAADRSQFDDNTLELRVPAADNHPVGRRGHERGAEHGHPEPRLQRRDERLDGGQPRHEDGRGVRRQHGQRLLGPVEGRGTVVVDVADRGRTAGGRLPRGRTAARLEQHDRHAHGRGAGRGRPRHGTRIHAARAGRGQHDHRRKPLPARMGGGGAPARVRGRGAEPAHHGVGHGRGLGMVERRPLHARPLHAHRHRAPRSRASERRRRHLHARRAQGRRPGAAPRVHPGKAESIHSPITPKPKLC